MKNALLGLVFVLLHITVFAQIDPAVDSIVKEGKLLYRLEMANWKGSDLFKKNFAEKAGGYLSYTSEALTKCIFYSKKDTPPKVLVTISFDSTFNTFTASIDSTQRLLTSSETELYRLRQTALQLIDSDTLFKVYPNSTLNLIPVVVQNNKRVFVLTGSQDLGNIFLGNDYMIRFGDDGSILEKKAFHDGIYRFETDNADEVSLHFHSRASDDYITATDICTLLLYERYTSWKQHVVVAINKVSIWDTGKEELTIIPKSIWDEIMKEREKRNQDINK